MSIAYSDLTTALGELMVVTITNSASATPSNDTNFNNILPRIIEAAEQRIYRELDFLYDRTTDSSTSLQSNSRSMALPTANTFVVVQGVNVITPAGAQPSSGSRNRLEMISKDVMDIIWPVEQGGATYNAIPTYGCLLNTNTLLVAPTPNANYVLEYTGITRPPAMSSTNTTTYLGTTYPDLFLNACMVFGMLYQKDADLPQGAPAGADVTKWETEYQKVKASVLSEIQRQKNQGQNWSNYSPAPESQPPRP
jgi:hypothetical protein